MFQRCLSNRLLTHAFSVRHSCRNTRFLHDESGEGLNIQPKSVYSNHTLDNRNVKRQPELSKDVSMESKRSLEYDREKLLNIYTRRLMLCALSRKAKERSVDIPKNVNELEVRAIKQKLYSGMNKNLDGSLELILDEDVEITAKILKRQAKSIKRMPPLDMQLLKEVRNNLNAQVLKADERNSFTYCRRELNKINKAFVKADMAVQESIMSNMLPIALPTLTSAFKQVQVGAAKARRVDPSFDFTPFTFSKHVNVLTSYIRLVTRSDPRKAYAMWAIELMKWSDVKMCHELNVALILLLDKIGEGVESELMTDIFSQFIKDISMEQGDILFNDLTAFNKDDLMYFFGDLLPKLIQGYEEKGELQISESVKTKLPKDDFLVLLNSDTQRYSILPPDDKCKPLDKNHIPPQLKLSNVLSYGELMENYSRQISRERKINVTLQSLEKDVSELNGTIRDEGVEELLHDLEAIKDKWRRSLFREISESLHSSKLGAQHGTGMLDILEVMDLSVLTEQIISIAFFIGSVPLSVPTFEVHDMVREFVFCNFYSQYLNRTRYREKLDLIYPQYAEMFYDDDLATEYSSREYWTELQRKYPDLGPDLHAFPGRWVSSTVDSVSKFVVTLLLKQFQVPVSFIEKLEQYNPGGYKAKSEFGMDFQKNSSWKTVPCFHCRYVFSGAGLQVTPNTSANKHVHLYIGPHLFFSALTRKLKLDSVILPITSIPSLVPPVPWCSQNHGGYLSSPCHFVRPVRDSNAERSIEPFLRKVVTEHSDVTDVFESVHTFASVPWKINMDIYKVLMRLFESGGDLDLDVPLAPEVCREYLETNPPLELAEENQMPYKRMKLLRKLEYENYSLRMSLLYQLSIAKLVKDEKAFWLPSNIDFRGRCYDVPPVFNHIGDDKTRALFAFAQGKPLGARGLRWLKLQLASLSGHCKKMSYAERVSFVDSHMNLVLDSAERPLDGLRWWASLDEPYQALACCVELRNSVSLLDPESYMCHLPVHQDGSCNGLQHYAALGRDEAGAAKVNLLPAERPQDVYQAVCDIVENKRRNEANEKYKDTARRLEGLVTRKVVKQTVMTQVYGVTHYGAFAQIKARLAETEQLSPDVVAVAARYLSNLVFSSIGDLFSATAKIKDWLQNISMDLSDAGIQTQWMSPLGLPVVQSYSKILNQSKFEQFLASPIGKTGRINFPNRIKNKNAFPPNYIHSLDASHMMMTSRSCFKNGLTFVHVHDCFWTHACDIDRMNEICREEFVRLHSEPLLDHLVQFISSRLLPSIEDPIVKERLRKRLQNPPQVGNLDLNLVRDSTFFFA